MIIFYFKFLIIDKILSLWYQYNEYNKMILALAILGFPINVKSCVM